MTKRQIIEDICRLNRSASPEFLSEFDENELWTYLQKLLKVCEKCENDDLLRPLSPEEVALL